MFELQSASRVLSLSWPDDGALRPQRALLGIEQRHRRWIMDTPTEDYEFICDWPLVLDRVSNEIDRHPESPLPTDYPGLVRLFNGISSSSQDKLLEIPESARESRTG